MIKKYSTKEIKIPFQKYVSLNNQIKSLIYEELISLKPSQNSSTDLVFEIIKKQNEKEFLKELETKAKKIYFFCQNKVDQEPENIKVKSKCFYINKLDKLFPKTYPQIKIDEYDWANIHTKVKKDVDNFLEKEHTFYLKHSLPIEIGNMVKIGIVNAYTNKTDYYWIDTEKNSIISNLILGLRQGETRLIRLENSTEFVKIYEVYKIINLKVTNDTVQKLKIKNVKNLYVLKETMIKVFMQFELFNIVYGYNKLIYTELLKTNPELIIDNNMFELTNVINNSNEEISNEELNTLQTVFMNKLFSRQLNINIRKGLISETFSNKLFLMFFWEKIFNISEHKLTLELYNFYISLMLIKKIDTENYKKIIQIMIDYNIKYEVFKQPSS